MQTPVAWKKIRKRSLRGVTIDCNQESLWYALLSIQFYRQDRAIFLPKRCAYLGFLTSQQGPDTWPNPIICSENGSIHFIISVLQFVIYQFKIHTLKSERLLSIILFGLEICNHSNIKKTNYEVENCSESIPEMRIRLHKLVEKYEALKDEINSQKKTHRFSVMRYHICYSKLWSTALKEKYQFNKKYLF